MCLQEMPILLFQIHGCLDESMWCYNFQYSTSRYGMLQLLSDHYNVNPAKPQNKYDGSMQIFLVIHMLSCSNGGLIIVRHNEIRPDIIHHARQAFSPNCVHFRTLI